MNLEFLETEPYKKLSLSSVMTLPEVEAGGDYLKSFLSNLERNSFYYDGKNLICLSLDEKTVASMKEGHPCIDVIPFSSYMLRIHFADHAEDTETEKHDLLRMTFYPASRFVKAASGSAYLFPDLMASAYYSLLLDINLSCLCEEYFLPRILFQKNCYPILLSVGRGLRNSYQSMGMEVF
ncbi:MAG: hypothetical protein IJN92_08645 [Lachnospiraceae bacterium]|nr:hypothetical protein [Lachnospiraceae bacterium]